MSPVLKSSWPLGEFGLTIGSCLTSRKSISVGKLKCVQGGGARGRLYLLIFCIQKRVTANSVPTFLYTFPRLLMHALHRHSLSIDLSARLDPYILSKSSRSPVRSCEHFSPDFLRSWKRKKGRKKKNGEVTNETLSRTRERVLNYKIPPPLLLFSRFSTILNPKFSFHIVLIFIKRQKNFAHEWKCQVNFLLRRFLMLNFFFPTFH